VSNGAKQAIWQALLATVSPGDEVIIPAPYWVSYPEMARLAGAEPVVLETTADEGWVLPAERLRAALTPRSRLLILCTPSNPTGAVYSLAQLRAIAEVVRDHPRLLVLSDEIYESITYAPAQHHSFAALDVGPGKGGSSGAMFSRTLTVNGFSKAFAMTGWRLGYLAAPKRFAQAAAVIQSQSTSGASSIAQHAAVAALALGPRGGPPVEAMVAEFQRRRDLVSASLREIPGVRLPKAPEGAFYALPDVSALVGPGAEAEGFGAVPDVDALAEYLLRVAHVATVPGGAFGAPGCLRLSYAASEEQLREAMRRLAAALEAPRYRRP
jgi:aspartate/glutamate/aspartate-prephenate aminotransferase